MTRRQPFSILLITCIASLASLPNPAVAAGIQIIAATGGAVPEGNGTLNLFNAPSLNAAGQAIFVGQLAGTSGGAADNLGLYRQDPGGLTRIIRSGSSTVGDQNVTGFFTAPSWIDGTGKVTSLVGVGSSPQTIQTAVGNGGPLEVQVLANVPSPTGGQSLSGVLATTVNDAGAAVYTALYTGNPTGNPANSENGVYLRAANGTHSTLLRRGDAAPGGGVIDMPGRGTINEFSQVALSPSVTDGPLSLSSVVRITAGSGVELARQGDVAADGVTTLGGTFSPPLINDSGQVAFQALYTQPSISRRGIFLADDAGLRLVAPGILPSGAVAVSDFRLAGVSNQGSVGFWADVGTTINSRKGMYVADSDGPTLVALEDTLIPSGGKYFRQFFTGAMAYNDAGDFVFLAELSNTVNGAAAGRGLFFFREGLGLVEVAKSGDAFDGSTISLTGVFFNGSSGSASLQTPDASLSGLSQAGHVGFSFNLLAGGSRVAIWQPDETFLAADFNEDHSVDADDVAAWRASFGQTTRATHAAGDANEDGDVDGNDFLTWQQQFEGDPASHPTPEPPSALLAALGLLALLKRAGCASLPQFTSAA